MTLQRTTLRRWARLGSVFVSALVVQLAVMSDLLALGAMADVMLVLAVAAGSVTDPDRGAVYGFAVGLTYDLMLGTPFGLSALVYTLVGYGTGVATGWLLEPRRWFHILVAASAAVVAVLTTVAASVFLGLAYPIDDILRVTLVMAIWNCIFILPARRVMTWAVGSEDQDDFWMALP